MLFVRTKTSIENVFIFNNNNCFPVIFSKINITQSENVLLERLLFLTVLV